MNPEKVRAQTKIMLTKKYFGTAEGAESILEAVDDLIADVENQGIKWEKIHITINIPYNPHVITAEEARKKKW